MAFFADLSASENLKEYCTLEFEKMSRNFKKYQKKRLNLHNSRFSHKLCLLAGSGWLPQMGNGVSFFFAPSRCTLAVCGRNLTVLGHL
jgi:hypothetical protein